MSKKLFLLLWQERIWWITPFVLVVTVLAILAIVTRTPSVQFLFTAF